MPLDCAGNRWVTVVTDTAAGDSKLRVGKPLGYVIH